MKPRTRRTDQDATDEDAVDDEESDPEEETGDPTDSDDVTQGGTGSHSRKAQADDSQTTRVTSAAAVDDPEAQAKTEAWSVEKKAAATITEPEARVDQAVVSLDSAVAKLADETEAPEVAAVAFASAAEAAVDATAAAPPFSGLLNVIGTVVFTLYNLATAIIGGPPILPANSGVTVRSSTLHLDCGCNGGQGVDVPGGLVRPRGRRRAGPAGPADLSPARLPGPRAVVQLHRGGARQADEQHRRRAVDHVELPRLRCVLARCAADA